jgi:hypothetical protein
VLINKNIKENLKIKVYIVKPLFNEKGLNSKVSETKIKN